MLLMLLLWQRNETDTALRNREVRFGETFTIEQGEQVNVVGEGEPLLLQLKVVNDSRCPANAVCGWLGNATATLKASNAQEKEKELQMCIGDCRPEPARSKHTLSATIGEENYELTLKNSMPYPGQEQTDEVKQIKLMVEQVTEKNS